MSMQQNRGRPTFTIPYWGGSVGIWINEDGSDTSIRSAFYTDQFAKMADGLGGNGPGREGYWWFSHEDSGRVVANIRDWAALSGEQRLATWSWTSET